MGLGKPDSFCKVAVPLEAQLEVLADGLHAAHILWELRGDDFVGWSVAMRLRTHDKNSPAQAMPGVWIVASHGAVFCLRRDHAIAGAIK